MRSTEALGRGGGYDIQTISTENVGVASWLIRAAYNCALLLQCNAICLLNEGMCSERCLRHEMH